MAGPEAYVSFPKLNKYFKPHCWLNFVIELEARHNYCLLSLALPFMLRAIWAPERRGAGDDKPLLLGDSKVWSVYKIRTASNKQLGMILLNLAFIVFKQMQSTWICGRNVSSEKKVNSFANIYYRLSFQNSTTQRQEISAHLLLVAPARHHRLNI